MDQNSKEQHDRHLQEKKKNRKKLLLDTGLLVSILIGSSLFASTPTHAGKPTVQAHITKGASLQIYPSSSQAKGTTQTPSIYYGVYASSWLQDLSAVKAFEHDAQKPVSIVMWYQGWGARDSSEQFHPTWMENVREHGSIPMISWEPWNYKQETTSEPAYSLQNIINGNFDSYITAWAQESKVWGHPYFLRFAAEMNGYWFPWSETQNGNRQGQYVKAWRHVHDLFTKQGATNVTWVWSPNMEYHGSIPLKGLYPGNTYVDWVGIDGYNWYTVHNHQWQTFSQVFQQTYKDILGLSFQKPLMIAETGSANRGNDKAGWIADAFAKQLPQFYPEIKAFVWFNVNKETDWRIESSSTTQAAFANAIASSRYASNNYASLNTSPIPIPAQTPWRGAVTTPGSECRATLAKP